MGACKELSRYWRGVNLEGYDTAGAPVLWERPGLLDWQMLTSMTAEQVAICEHICMDKLVYQLNELTVRKQKVTHQVTVVIDLEGFPMSFLWPGFKILKQIVQMDSNLYPELLRQVLLVRAPQKFQDVWKLAETYFEPGTWEKIILVPPAETSNVLRTHIPHEYIPRF